jgi:hypothetical protein
LKSRDDRVTNVTEIDQNLAIFPLYMKIWMLHFDILEIIFVTRTNSSMTETMIMLIRYGTRT